MSHAGQAVKANYRERMIEVKVRFWTNGIAKQKGYIVPKHAWTSGIIRMEDNDSHGIEQGTPRPFNSLMEIPAIIEKVLIEYGIRLHRVKKTEKYIV
jgi:hypothetical protein